MSIRLLFVALAGLLVGFTLSACAPGNPNPFNAGGDGRVYNPATHNYERQAANE